MDTIKLWIENRLDNEVERSYSDIWEEFKYSKYFEEYVFEPHSTIREKLIHFITFKDGLNASYDLPDFEALYDYVREASKREHSQI